MIRLQVADWVLELAPDVGGLMAAFYSQPPGGAATHGLRPAQARALIAGDPLGMASFPLVPGCNRIRHGRAQVGGGMLVPGQSCSLAWSLQLEVLRPGR